MSTESTSQKKVLVIEEVEDDVFLRKALNDKLALEGFGVLEAKNGEEGLTVALEHHPDLILLDILLPKMNGIELLKKLREDEWGKSARVIMLTNLDDMESIQAAMGGNVFEYYVKSDNSIESIVDRIKGKLEV